MRLRPGAQLAQGEIDRHPRQQQQRARKRALAGLVEQEAADAARDAHQPAAFLELRLPRRVERGRRPQRGFPAFPGAAQLGDRGGLVARLQLAQPGGRHRQQEEEEEARPLEEVGVFAHEEHGRAAGLEGAARLVAAGGRRDHVPEHRAVRVEALPALFLGPHAPVGVLHRNVEGAVPQADVELGAAGHQHGAAVHVVHLFGAFVLALVELEVAALVGDRLPEVQLAAGRPQAAAVGVVVGLGPHRADLGVGLGDRHQLAHHGRMDLDVVVEQQQVVVAGGERRADAQVEPDRDAAVLLDPQQGDLRPAGGDRLGGAVRGAVVDHDHPEIRVVEPVEALQGLEAEGPALVGEDDAGDARHAHAARILTRPGKLPPPRRAFP